MTGEDILSLLRRHIKKLQHFGVSRIGLFGSYSRNEQSSNSDIDLLVEFERQNKTFDNYMDLKFYLEDLFQQKVDLVIAENVKPELKDSILGSVKYA